MTTTAIIDATCVRDDRVTGIERFTREAVAALCRALPDWDWTAVLRDDTAWQPSSLNVVRVRPRPRVVMEQIRLPEALSHSYADLAFFPGFPPPYLAPRSARVVAMVHDAAFWRFPETLSLGARLYYKPLLETMLRRRRIDAVITGSESAAADVRRYAPTRAPVVGVPLGVRRFNETKGVDGRQHFALAVGTLEPRKNYETLFAAWEALVSRGLHIPLKIVGRPGWGTIPAPSSQVGELVEFLGGVSDARLHELYRTCRLFVMPTLYEGFGLPVLEALSNGCKCVVSDIPVFREVGGDALTYVAARAVDGWADAIEREWRAAESHSESTSLAQAAAFTWDRWAERVSPVFVAAMSAHGVTTRR